MAANISAYLLLATAAVNLLHWIAKGRREFMAWPSGKLRLLAVGWLVAISVGALVGVIDALQDDYRFTHPISPLPRDPRFNQWWSFMTSSGFTIWYAYSVWRRGHKSAPEPTASAPA